ncbi:MAG: hypothetical protein ACOZNI_06240 [Myxococcota bacterium]
MCTETVTLFGVAPFEPFEIEAVLRRQLADQGVAAEFDRVGDTLKVAIRGVPDACSRASARIPGWYRTWRATFRAAGAC